MTEEAKFQPPSGTSSRKPYIQLDTDVNGNPLLPDPTEWPSKGMDKKALIRSYVGSAYREWVRPWFGFCADYFSGQACGSECAFPPWMAFIEYPDKYFGSDQVPDRFKLLDPLKMKDPQIKEILTFWYSQQESNGFGFKFHQDEQLQGGK